MVRCSVFMGRKYRPPGLRKMQSSKDQLIAWLTSGVTAASFTCASMKEVVGRWKPCFQSLGIGMEDKRL